MSTTLMFVLFALILLGVFAGLALRRDRSVPKLDEALAVVRSLDIEAFRNLVNPDEDQFLRTRLCRRDFRKIRRERAQAALLYVKALSGASLQFARFGDLAQRSPEPAIAASGKQIANSAIDLRLHALNARLRLAMVATFPMMPVRPLRPLLDHYDRAAYLMLQHNGLERAHSHAS